MKFDYIVTIKFEYILTVRNIHYIFLPTVNLYSIKEEKLRKFLIL
jgi:hypothetical protein